MQDGGATHDGGSVRLGDLATTSVTRAPSELSVPLGDFAVEALRMAGDGAPSLAAVARRSLHSYLADRGRDRAGWAYPRFARGAAIDGIASVTVPIEVDDDAWSEFAREAAAQDVSTELLLRHAVLYVGIPSSARREDRWGG